MGEAYKQGWEVLTNTDVETLMTQHKRITDEELKDPKIIDVITKGGGKAAESQFQDSHPQPAPKLLLARLFFKEKKLRYCHHSGVGGGGVVVVVVTNFSLGYNFVSVEANLIKLHMLVHHHKSYNLTKDHNSARLFGKIMPLYRYAKWTVC